ncbi:54S ribosomal protein L19, mitochondrial-like [Prunus dulcis]|uniref:54S ribosomal protein L19, mitochondrial-like n=1 Tax=Prunus dulcis TaxID=3755 RepID=UPI0014838C8E|nr:54S ribosomal protein L19, mitochondrial-like [Prunus dulcis]
MMALCKDFNAQTQMFKLDVPVVVTLNNTYEFMVKSPSVNWYLRKATSLDSGSSRLKHVVASELSLRHVYEIAKVNQSDPYFQYMPALESICPCLKLWLPCVQNRNDAQSLVCHENMYRKRFKRIH